MAYLKLYQLLIGLVAATAIQAVPSNYARDALVPRGVPEPVRKLTFVPSHLRHRRQAITDLSSEEIEASTAVSQSETDVVSVQQTDAELVKKVVQIQAGNQEIIEEQDELRLEQLVNVQKTVVVQVVQQIVDVRFGVAVTSFAVRQITKVVQQQEEVTAFYQVNDANIITVGAGSCGADASAAVVGTGTAANVAAITTAASSISATPTAAALAARAPFQMNNQTMVLMPAAPLVAANMQVMPDPGVQVTGGNWTCGV